jgi:hypothetical protein
MMIIIFWEMTHGVISQKMIIIIVTAVETSNLTITELVILFFFTLKIHQNL